MLFFIILAIVVNSIIILGVVKPSIFKSWELVRLHKGQKKHILKKRIDDFPEIEEGKNWEYYKDFPRSAMS